MELSFFVIFVILNQHRPVTADLACESDQIENDGSCYYFSESKSIFASSKSFCEEIGMHLVYIGSQEEQTFLQSSLSGNTERHWIGLSQLTWIDGSSLDYNNFAKNESSNVIYSPVFDDGGICFRMERDYNYLWYYDSCSKSYYYICENEIEDSVACSVDYTENGGSCYYFSQSKSNFASLNSSCDDLGMHLVYIGSQEEQEFLVDNLPLANEDYWIGLSSVNWLDGSSLTYSNFGDDSHILDEGGECFLIRPDRSYQWFDHSFAHNHLHHYICEKEEEIQSSSVQQTTTGAATSSEGLTQTTPNQTDNIVTTSGSTHTSSTTDDAISETTSSPASTTPTSRTSSTSEAGQGSTDVDAPTSNQATDATPARTATKSAQTMSATTRRSSPRDRGIQSSSVQQTPGAATSPEGPTQTTPNQMTSSKTSSSTTQTDNVVTTSGSTQPSSTTNDAISETTSSPASTTPTSKASSTSKAGQGSTDAASSTSEQATDTTPATTATHTTQTMSSAPRRSSSQDRGHTSFKNFRLLASNVAHIDAYVLSSYTVSSMIECSQLCLTDVRCSCYTFIACEGLCLLGEECLATSTFAFERRTGAKFYSALLED